MVKFVRIFVLLLVLTVASTNARRNRKKKQPAKKKVVAQPAPKIDYSWLRGRSAPKYDPDQTYCETKWIPILKNLDDKFKAGKNTEDDAYYIISPLELEKLSSECPQTATGFKRLRDTYPEFKGVSMGAGQIQYAQFNEEQKLDLGILPSDNFDDSSDLQFADDTLGNSFFDKMQDDLDNNADLTFAGRTGDNDGNGYRDIRNQDAAADIAAAFQKRAGQRPGFIPHPPKEAAPAPKAAGDYRPPPTEIKYGKPKSASGGNFPMGFVEKAPEAAKPVELTARATIPKAVAPAEPLTKEEKRRLQKQKDRERIQKMVQKRNHARLMKRLGKYSFNDKEGEKVIDHVVTIDDYDE